jgi:hypothetical protein
MDETRLLAVFGSFVHDTNFFSRLNANESYTEEKSCWGEISIKYFGKYDRSVALKIKCIYNQDINGFQKDVFEKFHPKSQHSFPIKFSELSAMSSNSEVRKKFLSDFDRKLSLNLQNNVGMNCFLKSKWNWIAADNSHWNG